MGKNRGVSIEFPMSAGGQTLPKWVICDMSAFPLIATEERTSRNVSNVPDSDIGRLFDNLVGSCKQRLGNCQSDFLGTSTIDYELEFVG
jgi:hypothetical protein